MDLHPVPFPLYKVCGLLRDYSDQFASITSCCYSKCGSSKRTVAVCCHNTAAARNGKAICYRFVRSLLHTTVHQRTVGFASQRVPALHSDSLDSLDSMTQSALQPGRSRKEWNQSLPSTSWFPYSPWWVVPSCCLRWHWDSQLVNLSFALLQLLPPTQRS